MKELQVLICEAYVLINETTIADDVAVVCYFIDQFWDQGDQSI